MAETNNPTPELRDFIRDIINADLQSGKHTCPITRFPPEPNGYLHLGHAKSICLNFGLARQYQQLGARCHLRFDDTNPSKEDQEYVDAIQDDIKWLGFDWQDKLFYASDLFEWFYACAQELIRKGLAYVDFQTLEEMRANRGNLTTPGTPSPWRDSSVEANLAAFEDMRAGKYAEGQAVLRGKIDLASSNMNMRDPVLYRINHATHHNTGDKWVIYPMYDFAHPLEDAHEGITHSLCTLEFENHRPLYDWVIDNCTVPCKPRQIEFARLNLSYTVMSKRKLLQLVQDKIVSGWDDPRLPTLSGIRRRGYSPASIVNFCQRLGVTKFNSLSDVALLEHAVREDLNYSAPRHMAVLKPLKVVLENMPQDEQLELELQINPEQPELGNRSVTLTREVWIEQDDFMLEPAKKFYRLAPGRTVRLRGGYCITCKEVQQAADGSIEQLICEYIPGTIGASPPEGIECRAAIHWVSCQLGRKAEIRNYERLFNVEEPDNHPEGYAAALNPDSLSIGSAWIEPALAAVANEYRCQFERLGYYVADRHDHSDTTPVFNRIVALRDSFKKKQ